MPTVPTPTTPTPCRWPSSRGRWASAPTTWPSTPGSSSRSARRGAWAREEIDLRLDSKLIVEQLNGRWRVKDAKLQGLFAEARRHLATFVRWSATHEPRERNRAADALANLALDDPEAAAMLVAEVARRNGREPTPAAGRRHAVAPASRRPTRERHGGHVAAGA